MKVTMEFDNVNDMDELYKVMSVLIGVNGIAPMTLEVAGDAQQTVDEVRQVTEAQDAHVSKEKLADKATLLTEIQELVAVLEESGLRTRKEIVAELHKRDAKKFQELSVSDLITLRDEFKTVVDAMMEG